MAGVFGGFVEMIVEKNAVTQEIGFFLGGFSICRC